MTVQLYDFQQVCVDKLGKASIVSRLIGDEMGLGKTPEALAIDLNFRRYANQIVDARTLRTLIVAPLSVHDHWRVWTKAVQPDARICVIDRKDRPAFIKALRQGKHTHYICHYEALRLKDTQPAIRGVTWFHIIGDEVHRAKNRKALQTRALKNLNTKYKTGASGTPADNKPQDLWSILNWLYPRKYTSFWRFINTYCEQESMCRECGGRSLVADGPVVHTSKCSKMGQTFKKVVGVKKKMMPILQREMQPFYLRRLKRDVWKDMPDIYYTDIVVDLPPRQRKAYDQMRKHMLAWVGEHEDQELSAPVVIAQLVRLQQFALASPRVEWVKKRFWNETLQKYEIREVMKVVLEEPSAKLDALQEIIEDNDTEQHIVFSQSRSMINLVYERFNGKMSIGRYTGMVPQAIRDRNVDLFQAGELQIFAGTIAAGGESINLQASSTVHMLDRHWSPSRNNQAISRSHRLGQTKPVQVIDYIARNTVDLGRRAQIAQKWEELRWLLGDVVDPEAFAQAVELK